MTDDDILRMAREAGGAWEYNRSHPVPCVMYDEELIKFARLVAAREREKCAQVCEELRDDWLRGLGRYGFMGEGADYCADAIRARGEK